jgi:predicted transcriptional regulator
MQDLEELRPPDLRFANLAFRARAMTKRQTCHRPDEQFDRNDIVRLLKAAVEREGGQTAFAKRHRIDRSTINRVLKGKLPGGDAIAKVLRLRRVYIAE